LLLARRTGTPAALALVEDKTVIIIGAGLSGLAAAHDLLGAGCHVTVIDGAKDFGGLASSLFIDGQAVERFYHFICRNDLPLLELVRELGLERTLVWQPARTAFLYEGSLCRFGTPLDLLRFRPIPFEQRIRFGLHVMHSRYRSQWRWLDQIPAKPWIIESVGEEAYNVIWHPLLKIKFGDDHDKISAAWLWHRIWRVASSRENLLGPDVFGTLERGSATIIDALVQRISAHRNATLRAGTRVRRIDLDGARVTGVTLESGERLGADAVVSTAALPVLDKLLEPQRTEPYFARMRAIRYIGVVCVLMNLREPLSSQFWMNVNDSRISFNGVIAQSNLNPRLRQAGLNTIHVPFYLPTSHPRYGAPDEDVYREVVELLPRINPRFSPSWVKEWHVSRAAHAQAICATHFVDLIPDHRAPLSGLYVTDSAQFYPEDRTISMAIAQGRKAASLMRADLSVS
jgi:protoporphyrinogen oxidase